MSNTATQSKTLPPMLTQYLEYKQRYSDCLLLFQVGDFYELFFEDAVTVARTLNLTLTSRDKNSVKPVPMCGVPVAVVDGYADRLVDVGFSVALVSQCSSVQNGKGMVDRKLDRIITPGIRLFGNSVDQATTGLVAGVYIDSENEVGIAFSEVQTGAIFVREGITIRALHTELLRAGPTEVVLPRSVEGKQLNRRQSWVRELDAITHETNVKFRPDSYVETSVSDQRDFSALQGYSALSVVARKAVRLLINYVDETTVDATVSYSSVVVKSYEHALSIDATTRKNLDLVKAAKDNCERGSLLGFLNCTCTGGGYRLLRQWILSPLTEKQKIDLRLDAVATLKNTPEVRDTLQGLLKYLADIERIAARIELGIASPRELGALRDSIQKLPLFSEALEACLGQEVLEQDELLKDLKTALSIPENLVERLSATLTESPPAVFSEGGIIKAGFNTELDRLRLIRKSGRSWIAELERQERERTGITSLKIKFNNVLGYFIEVTKANIKKVPENYIRRQTMVNAERFFTEELKKQEDELLNARAKQIELERSLFAALQDELVKFTPELRRIHKSISELDVLVSFAILAEKEDLVRPTISTNADLNIEAGRHPILAALLKGRFIANALHMEAGGKNSVIITGPNMGGKSTYLRQAALIVIMAQIGSFVPARAAQIGIVDKIFARLGASDDLSEGESTFMVEMREASHILSNATERSLVLIDEIGRGTATADGLAIAQAILEWVILKAQCRTLFATHFHELTGLEELYPPVLNLSVGSVDHEGEVIFTHEIKAGAASRSYGIEVAKLAGLPAALLKRARALLVVIAKQQEELGTGGGAQISLFDANPGIAYSEPKDYSCLQELKRSLEKVNINNMSPIEALNFLDKIKADLRAVADE
ncbi:DNA mismatch repair protein MutS [Oligoflexia bacterium]|nr:DNA mismatch repair protein MutS [Oligoflexia bacterium]